jgi:hypothetical protein
MAVTLVMAILPLIYIALIGLVVYGIFGGLRKFFTSCCVPKLYNNPPFTLNSPHAFSFDRHR